MWTARQRAATWTGDAKALRRAPVSPVVTMSRAAREPKPMRPFVPVKPSPNGISAASSVVWSSASLTVMCSSRRASAATAVARWTAWASSRCRELRNSLSVATRPQITELVRETSDRTPAPKLRKSRKPSPPTNTSTGMSSSVIAATPPRAVGLGSGRERILRRGFMGGDSEWFGKAFPQPHARCQQTVGYVV
ncbi:hypothetical protein STSP_71940 [Streptomyces jeddahensis]|uniref:Uncharacterized protein n=1 Tax=Streptomyces jeddahensis TaxID=1716141 RepID=A0A177HG75_9ACTN|nr:hypothetical protein STSP_71940 [Streptomyces jeddahensis]